MGDGERRHCWRRSVIKNQRTSSAVGVGVDGGRRWFLMRWIRSVMAEDDVGGSKLF